MLMASQIFNSTPWSGMVGRQRWGSERSTRITLESAENGRTSAKKGRTGRPSPCSDQPKQPARRWIARWRVLAIPGNRAPRTQIQQPTASVLPPASSHRAATGRSCPECPPTRLRREEGGRGARRMRVYRPRSPFAASSTAPAPRSGAANFSFTVVTLGQRCHFSAHRAGIISRV